ncbi:MAG: hypothetical protein ACXVBF_07360, partial [Flavisolibacter sp.]
STPYTELILGDTEVILQFLSTSSLVKPSLSVAQFMAPPLLLPQNTVPVVLHPGLPFTEFLFLTFTPTFLSFLILNTQ